ncbi:hypothetical protein FNV43_RR14338 [Rhamnella rubrinervis]|uniref:Uncharacterized protein n=1 Tax=Rhamnella rubrinervis TaxID=2594499 RepID=A0A8K0H322_9ROSA|nr:hypothetical protein FNV43_RR14338 [Rhamnella rubrinervis]
MLGTLGCSWIQYCAVTVGIILSDVPCGLKSYATPFMVAVVLEIMKVTTGKKICSYSRVYLHIPMKEVDSKLLLHSCLFRCKNLSGMMVFGAIEVNRNGDLDDETNHHQGRLEGKATEAFA